MRVERGQFPLGNPTEGRLVMALTRTFFLLATLFGCEALLYFAWSIAPVNSVADLSASSTVMEDGEWIGAGAIAFCATVSLAAGFAALRTLRSTIEVTPTSRGAGSRAVPIRLPAGGRVSCH
jgi:hypothetical protein